MSDHLIVEFYDKPTQSDPVATVLALYGGDNPESAAETLAHFFLDMSFLRDLNWEDAGGLATRFILFQQDLHHGCAHLKSLAATLIERQPMNRSQLVKIYGKKDGPVVEFVRDAYTKPEELSVANYILKNISIETKESAA